MVYSVRVIRGRGYSTYVSRRTFGASGAAVVHHSRARLEFRKKFHGHGKNGNDRRNTNATTTTNRKRLTRARSDDLAYARRPVTEIFRARRVTVRPRTGRTSPAYRVVEFPPDFPGSRASFSDRVARACRSVGHVGTHPGRILQHRDDGRTRRARGRREGTLPVPRNSRPSHARYAPADRSRRPSVVVFAHAQVYRVRVEE